ncbi:unnamed protein product [Diamesa serratosioi]
MNLSDDYKRTPSDLREVIIHAKLDERNLTQICQAIYFPDMLNSKNKYKLLEVDPELLKEIENGNELTFKGALNEKVVLCSKNKTYEVRNAEQSNSLLVCPHLKTAEATSNSPLKSPSSNQINKSLDKSLEDEDENPELAAEHDVEEKQILQIFYDYMEVRQIQPKTKKIQDLMKLTLYTGPENESYIDKRSLFTVAQLFDTAQSSNGEFATLLRNLRCITLNGNVRILESTYEYRVLNLMLNLISENDWKLNEIDRQLTIESLDGIVPNAIVNGVFDYYTTAVEGTDKFEYSERMVCRNIATSILQEGLKFHVHEFLETCQSALPEGMTVKEEHLTGICLFDNDSKPPSVRGLLEENLPVGLFDRLKELFKIKEKWQLAQISPYIEPFSTTQLPITTILAKHVRATTENNVRYYVSKHK